MTPNQENKICHVSRNSKNKSSRGSRNTDARVTESCRRTPWHRPGRVGSCWSRGSKGSVCLACRKDPAHPLLDPSGSHKAMALPQLSPTWGGHSMPQGGLRPWNSGRVAQAERSVPPSCDTVCRDSVSRAVTSPHRPGRPSALAQTAISAST